MTSRSRRIGRTSFHFWTAQSLPGLPGRMSRRRKTTKSSAGPNPLLPGQPRSGTCSLWSRTQRSTPQRGAGGSLNLIKTANLPTRRSSKHASLATSQSKLATLSSLITHLNSGILLVDFPTRQIYWSRSRHGFSSWLRDRCSRREGPAVPLRSQPYFHQPKWPCGFLDPSSCDAYHQASIGHGLAAA